MSGVVGITVIQLTTPRKNQESIYLTAFIRKSQSLLTYYFSDESEVVACHVCMFWRVVACQ